MPYHCSVKLNFNLVANKLELTKVKVVLLIAILKLVRSIMAFGLASVFYYISKTSGDIDFNNSFKFIFKNQDVILTFLLSLFQSQNSEVIFQIALVFFSLGLLRLSESIGLLFDISWALYSSIATGVIYISLTIYLLYNSFTLVTFIFFTLSILMTSYLVFRGIKNHQSKFCKPN